MLVILYLNHGQIVFFQYTYAGLYKQCINLMIQYNLMD